ncbi:MAG: thiolase family protein [Candidatus Geothermincolia bacterium]
MEMNEVYYVDGIRTAFGRAGEKGVFWQTRADDMVAKVIRTLMERNPSIDPKEIDDNIWGATTQMGDQGLTMGRTTVMLAGLPVDVPGCSVDRMCAGGMTAIDFAAGCIALGSGEIMVAGGVEHMGHHPMGQGADPNPRFIAEKLVDPSALNMGMTAENLHDMFPEVTKDQTDEYALICQQKAKKAWDEGKIQNMIVPMTVWSADGWKVAHTDEQPRPQTTLEGLQGLKTPFRNQGRVTAGNSSGLNDGAAGVILASAKACEKYGLKPKMRMVNFAFAGVKAEIMGIGPVPSTKKVLERSGLTMDQIDLVELNEAFAVQAVAFMNEFGMQRPDDPRMNAWGGAIAFGHPLASSGARLTMTLANRFAEAPNARYGLTTMCVGLGQGGTALWENMQK